MNKYLNQKSTHKLLMRTFVWGGAVYSQLNKNKKNSIRIKDYDSKNTMVF